MKKRSQELRILDRLRRYGHITNRAAQVSLGIQNPFERIRTIRQHMTVDDMYVTNRDGTRFKIFYISKQKAMGYAKRNGLKVAA